MFFIESLFRQASYDLNEESMELVGREKEMAKITDFIKKKTATILHITGKPGTGKTSCVIKSLKERVISLITLKFFLSLTTHFYRFIKQC